MQSLDTLSRVRQVQKTLLIAGAILLLNAAPVTGPKKKRTAADEAALEVVNAETRDIQPMHISLDYPRN